MDANKKNVTLDDLALMVANGFESQNTRFNKLEDEISGVKVEVQGLRSSVNNYLDLSNKRYLELKAKQNVIVNWVKEIADKTGVKLNLEDLEKAA